MGILDLSQSQEDLRKRLGSIVAAFTKKQKPVTAEDLKVSGAMAAILANAIKPNLVQTIEKTPCLIHGGSFANVSDGNNSVIADKIAIKFANYVITESGFGSDMGAEKFFDIKCRASGLKPDACVIVCSVRALKMHSGDFEIRTNKSIDASIYRENVSAVERGSSNLDKHIENVKCFGVPVIVCINRFATDTEKEIQALKKCALAKGADAVAISDIWSGGSEGGLELAKAVIEFTEKRKSQFRFLYPVDLSIKEKISRVAKTLYGAKEITYSETAEKKIALYRKLKLDAVPICMAKTHLSLSHDPDRKGRPRGFKLPVNDLILQNGAGFITVLCGDVNTMPALPAKPIGRKVDIDKNGQIIGLC
jgi:formyltetrahydrofolate synthetase